MERRFIEDLSEALMVGMIIIMAIGTSVLIYMDGGKALKEILITFQPVIYGMALFGSLITSPILVFRQLWVALICNFAVSAGLMYLAQVVIESWR
ncbi:hypothetical protein [Priestia megaterium]|uniref:hypothetical protein n=1 Tax=Priestia megaterium TaxID=1404 RepID=UPI002E23CCDC|nr:hypothetical protein [Priestia megaterium]MED4102160.1 hypothetical protein [Priestia megaterium]MED4142587.1 hypothetical protein [Priestia megaterium]